MIKITVPAKWIGAGEHAILRQGGGLVFPCPNYHLTLRYQVTEAPLSVAFSGHETGPLRLVFLGILEEGMRQLGQGHMQGDLSIENTIPPGMGLGFSAALCVSIARLFHELGWMPSDQVFGLAHQLEHQFHGQSSGLDVAGVMHSVPVYYEPDGKIEPLSWQYVPCCALSAVPVGASATMHCIESVEALYQKDPKQKKWDIVMQEAVQMMRYAMSGPDRLLEWESAITLAADCFQAWGLVPSGMDKEIQMLKEKGALAVKPTGAGKGGHLLSVWPAPIDISIKKTHGLVVAYDPVVIP